MDQWEAATKYSEGTLYLLFEHGCLFVAHLLSETTIRLHTGPQSALSTPDGRSRGSTK